MGSISIFALLNACILAYFSLGYRVGLTYITSTTSPSYIFGTSNASLSIAITGLSIFSFVLIWISSTLLLVYNKGGLKKKYYILIGVSPVIFLSEYLFLWGFNYLRFTDLNMFHDMYTVTSNIGFPLGGIFFGLTFWILARNLNVSNESDNRSFVRIKESMYFTSIGIILLSSSTSPLDITKLPYPPFGLVSFSFMNVGAFSFFLGIYSLATSIAGNPDIRARMRNSEFLHSIATSQDMLTKRTNIVSILNTLKHHLQFDTNTQNEDIDKDYLVAVVAEKSRSISNENGFVYSRRKNFLGKSWEAWVEDWCRWYYDKERQFPILDLTDLTCQKWNQGQENQNLYFLTKASIKPSEVKIEYKITVPKDQLLLVPLINNLINFHEFPDLESENDLRAFAKNDLNRKTIFFLSINNEEIKHIGQYRIQSGLQKPKFVTEVFYNLLVTHDSCIE